MSDTLTRQKKQVFVLWFYLCSFNSPFASVAHLPRYQTSHNPTSPSSTVPSTTCLCAMSQSGVHESEVGLGPCVDRDGPELSPHAQVFSDHCHQRHAGHVDQPPGQHHGELGIVEPAADHVEKVDSDGEVQTLLTSSDEEPQAESTGGRRMQWGGQRQIRIQTFGQIEFNAHLLYCTLSHV